MSDTSNNGLEPLYCGAIREASHRAATIAIYNNDVEHALEIFGHVITYIAKRRLRAYEKAHGIVVSTLN